MLPVGWILDEISNKCNIPFKQIVIESNANLPIRIVRIVIEDNVDKIPEVIKCLRRWFFESRCLSIFVKDNEIIIAFQDS